MQERKRFNQNEFCKLVEANIFALDAHLELIDGTIRVKENAWSIIGATAVTLALETLRERLPKGFHMRVQLPLSVDAENEPLPDVVIVPGLARDYLETHPKTAPFVLEIADSTLTYDQNVKTALYASAGVPEYAVLDLWAKRLHVYRNPQLLDETTSEYGCSETLIYVAKNEFSPKEFPEITLTVAEILP